MRLPSVVRFIEPELSTIFYKLAQGDNAKRELFPAIDTAMDALEKNAFCGIQIQKRLIPKEYLHKYHITNLWKYNLPHGWRLLYSITSDEVIVVNTILEWLDHTEYERRFSY